MKCPRCPGELTRSQRHGVEIDSCPRCQGVWLDRGELQKIIQAVNDAVPASEPDTREPAHDDDDTHDDTDTRAGRKRGRRSLLNDLFDFR